MADQFEEVIEQRVAALEGQAAVEAESVKEHFAELRNFITFPVANQITPLRVEFSRDLHGVEQRLGARIDGLDQRFDKLDTKVVTHHEATTLVLAEILNRLPARNG